MIIKTQTEVLIDFSTILLNDSNNPYGMAILEKSLASFASGFLIIYIIWKKPCIIRSYNSVEAIFALLEFTPQIWTLTMLLLKNSQVGFIGMVSMTLIIVVISLVVLVKKVKKHGGLSGKNNAVKDKSSASDSVFGKNEGGNPDEVGLLAQNTE